MKHLLLISNMYPSASKPHYGIFVKNFVDSLLTVKPNTIVKKVVLTYSKLRLTKALKYLIFWCKSILKGILFRGVIYIHYPPHSIPTIIVFLIFRRKVVLHFHGSDLLVFKRLLSGKLSFVKRFILQKTTIVVPTNYFKIELQNQLDWHHSKNLIVSPSAGIKPIFFNAGEKVFNFTFVKLGFFSRFDLGKNWEVLPDLMLKLKQEGIAFKLYVIRSGAEFDQFVQKATINNLQDNLVISEPMAQVKLVEQYKKIDLFLFTTIRKMESLGLVGLEAMATGTPVIGSGEHGLSDYMNDGVNGYCVDVQSAQAIFDKIITYCNLSIDQKKLLSQQSVNTARHYAASQVAQKWLKDIERMIEN